MKTTYIQPSIQVGVYQISGIMAGSPVVTNNVGLTQKGLGDAYTDGM